MLLRFQVDSANVETEYVPAEVPGEIQVGDVVSDTVRLTWQVPDGEVTHYEISYQWAAQAFSFVSKILRKNFSCYVVCVKRTRGVFRVLVNMWPLWRWTSQDIVAHHSSNIEIVDSIVTSLDWFTGKWLRASGHVLFFHLMRG